MTEQILAKYGFIKTKAGVHGIEFKRDKTTVYVIPGKTLNVVIHPDSEVSSTKEGKIYHNTALTDFPKKQNNGSTLIHYGMKYVFTNEKELEDFAKLL